MEIKWNQNEEFEVIDQFNEATDNIDECHNQIFKLDEISNVDIIKEEGDYVDIQFGDGSMITGLHKSAFTKLDVEITQDPVSKKCGTDCPNCGADEDDIERGEKVWDDVIYQRGLCQKCGCEFKMYFDYTDTEFYMEQCERVPCPHPMSYFFNTMDEVDFGERVSTIKDCKECDNNICMNDHCLISDNIKPDYVRDLLFAAKKVIEYNAIDLVNPPMAKISDNLAKAVKNYEDNNG